MFFLTIIVGTTSGQSYKSIFGHAQTSWNVAYFVPSDWTFTDSLVVCNDTIINSYHYKSVKGSPFSTHDLDGYIREDTITGRVWYLDKSIDHKEYLIMDLSLNVGDTFIINNTPFPGDSISIVDSIKYIDGNKVLYLTVNSIVIVSPDYVLTFIEGIGPNAGIVYQHEQSLDYETGTILLCSYKDFVQVYAHSNPLFSGQCNVQSGGIEENMTENLRLKIFPNPSSDKIQIELEGTMLYSLEIFDYTGKIISSKTNIYSTSFDIDMTEYPSGIYLLKVKGDDGKYVIGKVLKL